MIINVKTGERTRVKAIQNIVFWWFKHPIVEDEEVMDAVVEDVGMMAVVVDTIEVVVFGKHVIP